MLRHYTGASPLGKLSPVYAIDRSKDQEIVVSGDIGEMRLPDVVPNHSHS